MSRLKQVRRSSRRVLMLVTATAVALLVSLIGTHSTSQATSGGSSYATPLASAIDTDPSPTTTEVTLVADEATVDIGNGVMAHAETFGNPLIGWQLPGPTFILNVGDTMIVRLVNDLSEPTGIHWHGIELENSADGTPFTQNQACSGCTILYKFKVTRPGIFWYHPHHHSSTNQVMKGLYGEIIVNAPAEASLQGTVLPSAANTFPIVFSDMTVCKASYAPAEPMYDPSLPWVGGGPLPAQQNPTARTSCLDSPLDADGNPHAAWAAGDIPNIQTLAGSGPENEGQTVLTNGRNVGARGGTPASPGALAAGAQKLPVTAGEGYRFQMVNASAIRYLRLHLTTQSGALVPLFRVGGEGGLLDNAHEEGGTLPGGLVTGYDFGEILLPPGSRADVVAVIPSGAPTSSVLTMWTEDYLRTGAGMANIPTVPVMHLEVTATGGTYSISNGTALRSAVPEPAVEVLGVTTESTLNPASFSPLKPGMSSPDITLTNPGNVLGINGIKGLHDFPGDYTTAPHLASARYARAGGLLQLTVENTTGAHHPFHLHGFSIQPISLTKSGGPNYTWPYAEFRDNVDIPPAYKLTFKIRLDDRPLEDGVTLGGSLGRWVFHCHIFFHATNGMLGEFDVLPASGGSTNGNEKPTVNVGGSWAYTVGGGTAIRHGTYSDPDAGDTVALTASEGTVTPTTPGHWDWSEPTLVTDDFVHFVYITATDNHGNKDQTVFRLKVGPLDDGSDNGDPHITTINGQNYDFQGVGEFTLLRDDDGLEIQARQTPVPTASQIFNTYTGLTSCVSINTAVAARLGAHEVSYQTPPTSKNVLEVFLDHKVAELGRTPLDLGHGYRISKYAIPGGQDALELDYPDETVLTVTPWFWSANNVWLLQVSVTHTPAKLGVMGQTTSGWLPALPNGTSLGPRPASLHDRYVDLEKTFADAWRVTDVSSLFSYGPGTSTATYSLPSWPPESGSCVVPKGFGTPMRLTGLNIKPEEADRLCEPVHIPNLHDSCAADVFALADPTLVANYKQQQTLQLNGTKVRLDQDKDSTQTGEPVTFVATVSPVFNGRPTPVGTVKFVVDNVATGPPVPLNPDGMAKMTTSSLPLGTHTVSARFTPTSSTDAPAYLPSTSPNSSHDVQKGGKVPPITVANLAGASGLNGWFTGPVTVTLQPYNGQNPPDQGGTTHYSVDGGPEQTYRDPFVIPKDGRHKVTFSTTSADGSVEKPQTVEVDIDSVKPAVSITAPADGSVFLIRSTPRAKYTCTDSLAGIDFCKGPVESGSSLDASKPGRQVFEVVAADKAGNTTTVDSTYTVVYRFHGFTPPVTPTGKGVNVVNPGDLIKVGFNLGANYGLNVFAGDFPLSTPIQCPDAVSHTVPPAGVGSKPGLSYTGHYVYGWQTSKEWAGTCRRFVMKLNDDTGNTYTADFRFTGRAVG